MGVTVCLLMNGWTVLSDWLRTGSLIDILFLLVTNLGNLGVNRHSFGLQIDMSLRGEGSKLCMKGVLVVKNLPANAGDKGDAGSIPELGRSPGGEHGNPFLYSCLENPMDREAWWTLVHGVLESDTTEATKR